MLLTHSRAHTWQHIDEHRPLSCGGDARHACTSHVSSHAFVRPKFSDTLVGHLKVLRCVEIAVLRTTITKKKKTAHDTRRFVVDIGACLLAWDEEDGWKTRVLRCLGWEAGRSVLCEPMSGSVSQHVSRVVVLCSFAG